jgi:hypothetical protein
MPRNSHLQDVLGFTTVAASTARHISISTNVPFLGGASLLVIAIVNMIKVSLSCCRNFAANEGNLVSEVVQGAIYPNYGAYTRDSYSHHLIVRQYTNRGSASP